MIDTIMSLALIPIFGIPMLCLAYWGWKFASLSFHEEKLKIEAKYHKEDSK